MLESELADLTEAYPEVEYWDDSDQERLLRLVWVLNFAVNEGRISDSEADDLEQTFFSSVEHVRQTT